jgi:diguanylate cyclase (GGDEF)-like protein/PAS domain S-box-containing protein
VHPPRPWPLRLAALVLGLLGAALCLHWVVELDVLTRYIPGAERTGIVTPALFVAAALCLWHASVSARTSTWLARLSSVCIAALIVLPLGYLFESMTGISLGIDIVRSGVVPTPDSPHPGRLSPNASLALLLAGIALWIHRRRQPTRTARRVFLAFMLAVVVVGVGGLIGYFVGAEVLYRVAGFNRMLPTTAFGLSVLGAGLWLLHDASQAFDARALAKSERRIQRRSIAVITLVAVAGGVAGFAVMRDTFEQSVAKSTLLTATTNATSLGHAIEVSLWIPRTVASRPAVRQALDRLSKAPDDGTAKESLQTVADSFLTSDLTGVEIYAAGGARVALAGSEMHAMAQVIQRLTNAGHTASLAWREGYVLLAETDVLVEGRVVGQVRTEQRMPLFDRLLTDIRASGDTSDVAICGRDSDKLVCAPNRFRPSGFELPMFDAAGAPALPVARALLGEQGVQSLRDRRGSNVLSAYTPIKDFGLGLAVRTDVQTLYAPLRSRANVLALALVAIVALAIYAQRSQVRPVIQQLVASERQLKAILEDQTELVSLARPDGGLIYVNPAYARHFGLTPEQMVGRNLFDFVVPTDRDFVRQLTAGVLSTGVSAKSENRMTAADGAEHWVAWRHSVQRDPAGQTLLHSVGRDVTERRRAEEALRAGQALLARMGRVAGVGGWEIDLQTGSHTWTEETRRIHEVAADFMPTMETALTYYSPESRSVIDAAVQRGIDRSEAWDLEVPMVTAKGRPIWVRAQGEAETQDGKPVRLVGAIQDITERKLADRALRTLTAIFDATTDYVVQLDTQGRITYMNPAARRRTGVALDASLADRTLADFNPPDTLERYMSEVWPQAMASGVWVGESMVWDAERREFPVSHIVIAHRDEDGRVEYLSALMRDISAAKAAEQALRDSEHRLRMVTDNLPVLISYLDRDLRFRFLNRTYQQWFGSEGAPTLGTTVRAFYGEQAWVDIEPQLRAALQGRQLAYDREMVGPEGPRHVQVTVVPDRDEKDGVAGLYTLISDVTSYREAQQALQESEARLHTIADALPMRVAFVDAEERYRFNNLAYERGFGRPRAELYGKTVRELLGDPAYKTVEPHVRAALRGESVTFQSELVTGDSYVCYEAHYIPQLAGDGRTVLGFHAVITDITRQKVEERRLIELARVDPLTGLINRAGFELHVAEAMQRSRATGSLMALMYLDIDRFKQINDRYGHNAGDALLRAFAGRLTQTLRSTDVVARLGGDEFTVIMEGLPRPEVASAVANKIVQAMRTPFVIEQHTLVVTTSVGLAFYQGDATTVEALVKQADVALYAAKGAGRNNVQVSLRLIEGGRA